ncbi:MAG: metallophosphatase [Syntrophothermus sp.]
MIYVTGDKHGDFSILRQFVINNNLKENDYIIILGDSGLMWNDSTTCQIWFNYLSNLPCKILIIDGNHERFPYFNNLPIKQWHNGYIHELSNNIYHLMRGEVFKIDDKSFFVFGGAESIDKAQRIENVSWWKEELPSSGEYDNGYSNLRNNDYEVDYILTHCCSIHTFNKFKDKYGMKPYITEINEYFNVIEGLADYKHWYFGHYHFNEIIDRQHTCLYEYFVEIN